MTPFETWRQSHVTQLMGDFEDSMTKALTEAYLHGCHDGHAEGYLVGARESQGKAALPIPPRAPVHCYREKGITSCGLAIDAHPTIEMTGYLADVTCKPCFDAMRNMI